MQEFNVVVSGRFKRGRFDSVDFGDEVLIGTEKIRFDSKHQKWFDRFGNEVSGYTSTQALSETFWAFVVGFKRDGDFSISKRIHAFLFTSAT